jgi:predicted DNA-binding transcriptional regulator YafY
MSVFLGDTAAMRASRLLSILMLLQSRGRLSAPALAAELQVSVRTIYRDVDQLSAAGVPLWAETGRQGGICLREGWRTQLTGLTAPEARAVVLAGLPGPAAELGLGDALPLAQLKLLAALPAEAQADAQRVAARFHLDPGEWYRDSAPPPVLQAVAEAVWSHHRLALRYESWQRTSDQVLEPLGLVLKAGTWYMAARKPGRSDARAYRLDAVVDLRVLEQGFEPPPRFDLATWWRESTARFEAGLYTDSARLQVTEEGYRRLGRFSPTVALAAADSAVPTADEGWVEVQVPIESVAHAASEMLRLGDQARVLAPAALRRALHGTAQRMALAHADPP